MYGIAKKMEDITIQEQFGCAAAMPAVIAWPLRPTEVKTGRFYCYLLSSRLGFYPLLQIVKVQNSETWLRKEVLVLSKDFLCLQSITFSIKPSLYVTSIINSSAW